MPLQTQTASSPKADPWAVKSEAESSGPSSSTPSEGGWAVKNEAKDTSRPPRKMSLWEALITPPKELDPHADETAERLRTRMSSWLGMHLPRGLAAWTTGISTFFSTLPLESAETEYHLIAPLTTPLSLMSMGAGGLLSGAIGAGAEALSQSDSALVRAATAYGTKALSWGIRVPFIGYSLHEALTPRQPGETLGDSIERRLTSLAQIPLILMPGSKPAVKGETSPLPPKEAIADIVFRPVGDHLMAGEQAAQAQVSRLAQGIEDAVDSPRSGNPAEGFFDTSDLRRSLEESHEKYFKTTAKVAAITPGNARAEAAFNAIHEAAQRPRWTWAETAQVRSALGTIRSGAADPKVAAMAAEQYGLLTDAMRSEAERLGMGDDFRTYNQLHSRLQIMREKYLDAVRDSKSGADVSKALTSDYGYVYNSLPSLEPYGVDAGAVQDAMELSRKPAPIRLWESWATRHMGGALFQSMGLPYIFGYIGAGRLSELGVPDPRTGLLRSPYYERGKAMLGRQQLPAPMEPSTPRFPEPPPEPPVPPATSPPISSTPISIHAELPAEASGGAPAPTVAPAASEGPLAVYQKALVPLNRVSMAIAFLQRASRSGIVTEGEIGVQNLAMLRGIERHTGLDLSQPENLPKALRMLVQERKMMLKEVSPAVQRAAKNPASPPAPAPGERAPAGAKRPASVGTDERPFPVSFASPFVGRTTAVITPAGPLPAHYALMELSGLKTSHDPMTFAPRPGYPQFIQERNYDINPEAQTRVIQHAQNFESRFLLSDNPDGINGPPIVRSDGLVLSGNGRSMSLFRFVRLHGGLESYRAELMRQAGRYGLDPRTVADMKEPVLVRVLESPASGAQLTDEYYRQISHSLNVPFTGALSLNEQAVSAGRSVSAETVQMVSGMLEELGENSTIAQVLQRYPREVLNSLVSDGVVTAEERPRYVQNGALTEQGKSFISKALLGKVVDDPALLDASPPAMRAVTASLAPLSYLKGLGNEWDITPLVRTVLREQLRASASGLTVEEWGRQERMFDKAIPAVQPLLESLSESGINKSKTLFRQFALEARTAEAARNTPAFPGMTSVAPRPYQVFNDIFGGKLSEDEYRQSIIVAARREAALAGR